MTLVRANHSVRITPWRGHFSSTTRTFDLSKVKEQQQSKRLACLYCLRQMREHVNFPRLWIIREGQKATSGISDTTIASSVAMVQAI